MNALLAPGLAFGLMVGASSLERSDQLEAESIAKAKSADIALLEPGLPKGPLEKWIREAVGQSAAIVWEGNDCGEQGGPPREDFPICAEGTVSLPDGRRAGVSIAVGTFRTGVRSKPALWLVYGISGSKTEVLRNLSDLRAWLKRPTAK